MMRAVRIEAPRQLRVTDIDVPEPAAGQALVRVAWSGICGSDSELFEGRRPAEYVRYPIVPGHEWSGTVAGVGDGVDAGLLGRCVVGEGFRSCQMCASCRRGQPNVCEEIYDETGFTTPGAWAEFLTIPARLLHVLPEGADLRAAALLEPAACVAEAVLCGAPLAGENVAVVGGGTLGLLATQLIRASSPADLIVVDPNKSRAELAVHCGASKLVTPDEATALYGRFDLVVEAAGALGALVTATELARRGARIVLAGIPGSDRAEIGAAQLVTRHLTVHTVFGAPPRAWLHAVNAFARGMLNPGLLVTHEFRLEETEKALSILVDRTDGVGKVLLHP